MKKLSFALMCMAFMLIGLSNSAMAQEKKNPFIGEWVLTADTPMGETPMNLVVELKDGKVSGYLKSEATGEDKVEAEGLTVDLEKKELSFSMFAQGYDVPIVITMKEDGTVEGSMMDMFAVTGKKK